MKRSIRDSLPESLRDELDARLRATGFGDYAKHREWLADKGAEASISTLWRYGQTLKASDQERAAANSPELILDLAVNQWPHRPGARLLELAKEVKETCDWLQSHSATPNQQQDVES